MILPAYLNFSILDDSDIAPSYPVIERIDQDDSILCLEKKQWIFKFTFSAKHIPKTLPLFARVSGLLDQSPGLNSTSPILRC
jgi:hypothetical protein